MYDDPKSKIGQLEKILNAREDHFSGQVKRHKLHSKNVSVNQSWDNSDLEEDEKALSPTNGKKTLSFPLKFLLGSVIFFILAIIIVAYKFLVGGNLVSGNNIVVTVKAPISVAGGESVPFEIEIKNNNNVTLSGLDLGITFPSGTKQTSDPTVAAKRIQEFIGDILPGQSVKKNISVILFGQENEKKDIKLNLEYKVAGSNSLFNKEKTVSVVIGSSPLGLIVSAPQEINTNQTLDFTVEVVSNSSSVMSDLLLKADYPFGFSFIGSNPKTFSQNNLWYIGDLAPGAKRTIKFSGILIGQEGEDRSFNFSIGPQSATDDLNLDVSLNSAFSLVTIRRPFVSADILLNGLATGDYVSSAGSKVNTLIKWRNNLPYEVSDVSIAVKISGNSVNKASVQVDDGLYRSIDNTIIFNQTTDQAFTSLEPGAMGESQFSFSSFSANSVTGSSLINPTITLDFYVKGRRLDYDGGQEDVFFSSSRRVKVTANPVLYAKALYYTGPLQNRGPIPPKAEQETTYTINWMITNPLNNLSNTEVTAVLPPYIKWLSVISPKSEKVSYDSSTGKVTWFVGNISSGAGTVVPAREVSFQVSLLPSVDQIGKVPELIGDALLKAQDTFTLTEVSNSFNGLNTRLNNDPYFRIDGETVVQ